MQIEVLLNLVFTLIGGLGIFMLGMKSFSDGLHQSMQQKVKDILSKITNNRLLGIILGFLATTLVQSSSAITVMTVGFVNAQVIALRQAINIILGANVGTTVTGWIITLNISYVALPMMGIGALMLIFGGTRRIKTFGSIIMGFGMIFYGLLLMKDAFLDVREREEFRNFFLLANADTISGRMISILIGALITAIVQSSSVTTTIIISLSYASLIDYPTAIALILGENIGTTVTANLASIGASVNARRASLAHFIFNVTGVIYMIFLFPFYLRFVDWIVPGDPSIIVGGINSSITYHIAAAHTIFNIVNVVVFFFFIDKLTNLVCVIYKDNDGDEPQEGLRYLSVHSVDMSSSALTEVKKEIVHMGEISGRMINRTLKLIDNPKEKMLIKIESSERALDEIQSGIHKELLGLLNNDTILFGTTDAMKMITISTFYENLGDNLNDMSKVIFNSKEQKAILDNEQTDDIKTLLALIDHYIYYISQIIDEDMVHNKNTIYNNAREVFDFIKSHYYYIRGKHYKRVEESNTKPLNADLFGDILIFSNRSMSNTLNIIETWTGKE